MEDEYASYMLSQTAPDDTTAWYGMGNYNNPVTSAESGVGLPGEEAAETEKSVRADQDVYGPAAGGTGTTGTGGVTTTNTTTSGNSADALKFLKGLIVGDDGKANPMGLFGIMALLSMMRGSGAQAPVGYQGGIPKYSAVRERVPIEADPNRRPGAGGRRYFSDTTYVPQDRAATAADANAAAKAAAVTAAKTQAAGLKQAPYTAPVIAKPDEKTVGLGSLTTAPKSIGGGSKVTELLKLPQYNDKGEVISVAQGGLMNLAKGRYLNGATDGMADKIPANIDGQQPAALSHGEFVIPADVVSHLGNGNSESGAQRLYDMMDRIRKARTGSTKQGKQINPDKFLPR